MQIASYTHQTQTAEQEPDTAPGPYYVSARDGERYALASGPYDTHQDALAAVQAARTVAERHDPFLAFASFGTVRMKPDYTKPGMLQKWGYPLIEGGQLPEIPKKLK